MIPSKIQALFTFIDYLNDNKNEYIEKYIPLTNELLELDKKRRVLNPNENYRSKQLYDEVQKEIDIKFPPLINYVYEPITNKLKQLEIWTGDEMFLSIWNNNIGDICDFKREFSIEDVPLIMESKLKYKSFREETNSNFMCLSFVFTSLDEILKELFDFFKDTEENEFEKFENKILAVNNLEEVIKSFANDRDSNTSFSFPIETLLPQKQQNKTQKNYKTKIKNKIVMGDNIKTGDISNKSGQINVGKGNVNEFNDNDNELAKKSFNWQKWGIIVSSILAVIAILVTLNWDRIVG
ncbi:hypothetical protein [Flavobacterium quisquiliarum]|uniref:Uncharacterized protein n=1 Tax=Flavobacterium quisquiliarum TaxID=1834436 RepID=A0ABV8W5P5_9FLAO|nr:hypothetical protein [Flavobacterium quisquiliarum]MBW1656657.1 hypothetical protein [Flavobacterium quisquiliarum]